MIFYENDNNGYNDNKIIRSVLLIRVVIVDDYIIKPIDYFLFSRKLSTVIKWFRDDLLFTFGAGAINRPIFKWNT